MTKREFLDDHRGAMFTGSVFPDAFESSKCYNGKFADLSTDSKSTHFLNVTVNYIRRNFKQPWNYNDGELVAFLFGVTTYQVMNAVWYRDNTSVGIVKAMANLNHHGNVTKALEIIQFSSDVILEYNLDLFYMKIYKDCLETSYGAGEAFSEVAKLNPFLVRALPDYFLGGLDDVAKKTTRLWTNLITMIENGTSVCTFPDNPLDIKCNGEKQQKIGRSPSSTSVHKKNWLKGKQFCRNDVTVQRKTYSTHFTPNKRCLIKIKEKRLKKLNKTMVQVGKTNLKDNRFFDGIYYINSSYARLGWSQVVCDVNHDGYDDVILGAPGYSNPNNIQQGAVIFVYEFVGSETGMPWKFDVPIDLTNLTLRYSDILLGPSSKESQFGSSLECLDINVDGRTDLVVAAPGYGNTDINGHNGRIFIYYGRLNSSGFEGPNITITCKVSKLFLHQK
ncbi:phosphatidylinositol-glycan-specific phospholipase D-like [Saccostrea echinata]|uniref:phosphatidylinositol-glycan-specific phospholipase D-like n=1 Tax=Saccostrea echinata TaxID=191078 RepID=UPI002A81CAE2|nr:phosphatidylinositol-glycan-specific phospholipase D-like [Saccostrea echinata]